MTQLQACQACHLRAECRAPVPAEPNINADIMFVAEAPGANEDKKGRVLIGKSGEEFWNTLWRHTGLNRRDVYVTNTVKCRPVDNRTPTPDEAKFCGDMWLKQEIELVNPRLIVAMGRTAAEYLLGPVNVEWLHGTLHEYSNACIPVLITYHPAAGLHNEKNITLFERDIKCINEVVDGVMPRWDKLNEAVPIYNWHRPGGTCMVTTGNKEMVIGLDTETMVDDEDATDRLGSIPLYVQASASAYFATAFKAGHAKWLKPYAEDPDVTPVVHNGMFDIPILQECHIDISRHPKLFDTMLAADILQIEPRGLKALALRHAGMHMNTYNSVIAGAKVRLAREYVDKVWDYCEEHKPKWWTLQRMVCAIDPNGDKVLKKPWPVQRRFKSWRKDDKDIPELWKRFEKDDPKGCAEVVKAFGRLPVASLRDADPDDALDYACADADATRRVYFPMKKMLEDLDLMPTFRLDTAAMRLVLDMEKCGMPVDVGEMRMNVDRLTAESLDVLHDIEIMAGRRINPGSPKQMAELLYDKFELFPGRPGSKHYRSTNDKVMELLSDDHPVIERIQTYRELTKLITSYCRPIISKCDNSRDGRLHARLKVTGTETGRMTANDPNVLSIPSRTKYGKMIKRAFRASEGCGIVNADFSQVELRLFAVETGEPALLNDYINGRDVHRRTAATMYNLPPEEITGEQRSRGKTVNFGVIYGIQAEGLSRQLICSVDEAQEFIDNYFEGYTRVKPWMQGRVAEAKRNGYVRDRFGRIRWIGGINSVNSATAGRAERQSCNAPIQSAASHMIKRSMVEVQALVRDMREEGHVCNPLIQVHDALVFEVSLSVIEEFCGDLKELMENVVELPVPVVADVSWGPNWADQDNEI